MTRTMVTPRIQGETRYGASAGSDRYPVASLRPVYFPERPMLRLVDDSFIAPRALEPLRVPVVRGGAPATATRSVASFGFIAATIVIALLGVFFVSVKDAQTSSGLVANSIYSVKPGDTVWSISSRFANGGDISALEYRIVRELGTTTIVPGEKIRIP